MSSLLEFRPVSLTKPCACRSLSYTLSHLMSVIEHMEPTWTRALLRRTRFLDPDFQGDILAVISIFPESASFLILLMPQYYVAMISISLKTGNPLPQITPCPLLDRFMLRYHALDVFHKENKDDHGIPDSLTFEMLQNEQYMWVWHLSPSLPSTLKLLKIFLKGCFVWASLLLLASCIV